MSLSALSFNAWLRYDLIRRLLERVPDARSFLEVGCGGGALGRRLAARYDYVGYEPDVHSYRRAVSAIGDSGTLINSVLPLTPTRSFDVIGAFEVLEHLEDDEAALHAWRRWIRDGGAVLLSVPANPRRYSTWDEAVGHYRRYSPAALASVLTRAGFSDVVVWSFGFPLGYALEAFRNSIARIDTEDPFTERTAASGRILQMPNSAGWMTRLATKPFRVIQWPFRDTSLGTGLVALARRAE